MPASPPTARSQLSGRLFDGGGLRRGSGADRIFPHRNHGATDGRAPKGFAPIAIGLCLTLIHLVCIPVTNTSVNPARSTGPAIFAGGWALQELWMFWVAPLIGGALGGAIYKNLFGE
jgi:glycerol uptake facilitator-like aquaporin